MAPARSTSAALWPAAAIVIAVDGAVAISTRPPSTSIAANAIAKTLSAGAARLASAMPALPTTAATMTGPAKPTPRAIASHALDALVEQRGERERLGRARGDRGDAGLEAPGAEEAEARERGDDPADRARGLARARIERLREAEADNQAEQLAAGLDAGEHEARDQAGREAGRELERGRRGHVVERERGQSGATAAAIAIAKARRARVGVVGSPISGAVNARPFGARERRQERSDDRRVHGGVPVDGSRVWAAEVIAARV